MGEGRKPSAIICHGYPGDTKNRDLVEELALNGYTILVSITPAPGAVRAHTGSRTWLPAQRAYWLKKEIYRIVRDSISLG